MAARKRKRAESPTPPTPTVCPVVGIGASAGGVEALQQFFDAVPADSPLAFVVIVHLDPARESHLAEIVARHATLKVEEVRATTPVAPGHVYVIPPNKYLAIKDRTLHLSNPVESRYLRIPIDFFFRSLAEDCKESAIGIVLSGTGSEGTQGLKEIHARGGMTIVQDPETAIHAGMPRAALATGIVDLVLPVSRMPDKLIRYAHHPYVRCAAETPETAPENDQDALASILALVKARTQRDFRRYKRSTMRRRIERRMGLSHVVSLGDYLTVLRQNPIEVSHLAKDMLICVTNFFRDPPAWEVLAQDFLGPLVRLKEADEPLRVWLPGCATGEEPYSLAIVLHEQLALAQKTCPVQVFATDLNPEALNIARAGIYPLSIAADVAPDRLRRFFTRIDDHGYQICKSVREAVAFALQDLTSDPPLSRLDLIVCRNLLIYLELEAQQRVLSLFHFALQPGGGLFLGTSESVSRHEGLFEPINKKWHLYRRIGAGRRVLQTDHRLASSSVGQFGTEKPMNRPTDPLRNWSTDELTRVRTRRPATFTDFTRQLLLEQFAPAAVLVDRHSQILSLHGPTSRYLQLPSGEPTLDLMGMAPEELGAKLRGALQRAIREGQPVTVDGVQVRRDSAMRSVRLTIRPVAPFLASAQWPAASEENRREEAAASQTNPKPETRNPKEATQPRSDFGFGISDLEAAASSSLAAGGWPLATANERLYLVTFEDETPPIPASEPGEAPTAGGLTTPPTPRLNDAGIESVVRQLEYELRYMREDLQNTIEELETSNEELKASNEEIMSINEELQSANEELETAKEELQSLNEELNTLNSQLKDKVEELESANNDLANLLACTDFATIFLDSTFAIKRFTPATARLVNLIASDVGRPLSDIAPKFTDTDLLADAQAVLANLTPIEKEIRAGEGRYYTRRILPYRTQDNRIEGVVVTFVDITTLRQAVEQTRVQARQQAALAEIGLHALRGLEPQALLDEAVQSVAETLGVDLASVLRLEPNGGGFCLEAGVGWKPGAVGRASLAEGAESQAGFTLQQGTPVVVQDQASEHRFPWAPLLAEHTAVSGITVVIHSGDGAYGVLAAHARSARAFADNDTLFLQAMANVLAQGLDRHRREQDLRTLNATLEHRVKERTGLMKLLQDVTVAANEAESVEAALRFTLWRVCEHNGWQLGHVLQVSEESHTLTAVGLWYTRAGFSFERFRRATQAMRFGSGEGPPGRMLEDRTVHWIRDISADLSFPRQRSATADGIRASISFPILIGRELTHVLEFFSMEVIEPEPGLLEVMSSVGTQLGRVVERQRLQAQLAEAVWNEQRRLGQELHDTVGQELTGLGLIAKSLEGRLRGLSSAEVDKATQVVEGLQSAVGQVRNLAQGLFPAEIDAAGLALALVSLAERTQAQHGIECAYEEAETAEVRQSNQAVIHLFYIAREAVTNAVKHARARHILIRLEGDEERLSLEVRDDGIGFREEDASKGMGLRIMRYRAALIGARLAIRRAGQSTQTGRGGTLVICTLRQEGNHEPTGVDDGGGEDNEGKDSSGG